MKLKKIFLIILILMMLSSLTSCYYPEFYSYNNSDYKTDNSVSQSTESYNSEDTIFFRNPCRDPQDSNMDWTTSYNEFGNFLPEKNGYHGGEDWNLTGGGKKQYQDADEPVYAIGKGKIIAVSHVGKDKDLGYIVVIEHTGSFKISAWSAEDEQGNIASYPAESDIEKIYSVYLHLDEIQSMENEEKKICDTNVDENTIIGYIWDPREAGEKAGFKYPHLHFEIRKYIDNSSNDWSLVGKETNWIDGYYIDLQEMLDAGLRDPSEFIDENRTFSEMIKKIQGNN